MKVITDWKILRNKVEEEFDFDNPQIDPKEFKEITGTRKMSALG